MSNETAASTRNRVGKSKDLLASPFEIGKIQPQAVELEEAVLGALMIDKDALSDTIDRLSPDSFYKEAHQKIYEAIFTLFNRSSPVDILTVTEQLKSDGNLEMVGGAFYVSQLTSRVSSSANIEYHASIIAQKHILRDLIKVSTETIKNAYDETIDVFSLLDDAERNLFQIAERNLSGSNKRMEDLLTEAIEKIEELSQKEESVSGIPSGFTGLDKVTSGFQPSDLIILAARPGMGKTAFVLALARNAAVDFNKPIALFSLEMSSLQLVNRLISSETELSQEKLKKGNLQDYEWEQLHSKISKLSNAKIFLDDTAGLSVFDLRAKCRRLKAQHDIQMIVIDYLQLMVASKDAKGNGGNREQEISTISRALKGIAKELNVPVIALSQLNRSVETRSTTSKKPQLSDLRESGAIEQDADMVMFIYRPEYYKITEDEQGNSLIGMAELIIAKHRNGALEDVKVRFESNLAKFKNLEDDFDSNNLGQLSPNNSFDNETGSMIMGSKMNKDDMNPDFELPPAHEDDSPF